MVPSPLEAHTTALKCEWDRCRHLILMGLGSKNYLLLIAPISFYHCMVYKKQSSVN